MVLLFQPLKIGFLWWQGTSVETWVSTLLGRFLSMLCLLLLDKIKIPNQKFNDFWKLEIYKKVYLFCNKFNFIWLLVAAPLLHCACFLDVCFYSIVNLLFKLCLGPNLGLTSKFYIELVRCVLSCLYWATTWWWSGPGPSPS